jgi:hypothetical protein
MVTPKIKFADFPFPLSKRLWPTGGLCFRMRKKREEEGGGRLFAPVGN